MRDVFVEPDNFAVPAKHGQENRNKAYVNVAVIGEYKFHNH